MKNNKPNLFIIGMPKCGTTTLHGLLSQHPQVYMCEPKEPRFFSRNSEYKKGFEWYLNTYFKNSENHKIRGEATPTYLYLNKKTIPRIKECITEQNIKFIAVFRNPIDRAYSHYWFNYNTKFKLRETLSFEEALAMEDERIKSSAEFYEEGRVSYAYFQMGLYAQQVQAFLNEFGRQHCHWLLLEDLLPQNFSVTIQNLENFLSIDSIPLEYIKKKESVRFRSKTIAFMIRQSRSVRKIISAFLPKRFRARLKSSALDYNTLAFKYPEMHSVTREMMFEKYQPSILSLQKILGRDLSHWR